MLVARSAEQLDRVIQQARPRGIIQSDVRPRTLYEGKVDREVPFHVPRLARALRGQHRDVLVDSVLVEAETLESAIRRATTRINRAFFLYRRLEPAIEP